MGLISNIMGSWEKWSQKQYDIFGSKLQSKYDFWDAYDNPQLRATCQAVWVNLSPDMQKSIYNLLVEALKKYGPEFARELIAKLTEVFLKIVKK